MEKNKKNFIHTITHTISHTFIRTLDRLTAWVFGSDDVAVYARPIHRDIHLNSSTAIRIYLSMLDRPIMKTTLVFVPPGTLIDTAATDRQHSDVTPSSTDTGGGTPDEDEE